MPLTTFLTTIPNLTIKLVVFTFCTLSLLLFLFRSSALPHLPPVIGPTCSPQEWSSGSWVRKPHPKPVIKPDDVYEASGFLGCASNREVPWHLANDHPTELGWRGNVSAYDYVPGKGCRGVKFDRERMVIDLVENGGWLLIGDSVTQEHFFSLSCSLYPHVRATPDYSGRYDWDRAWPQNLYLHPESPLLSRINFPAGFDINKTPLATFRRVDLLFNRTEIETQHNGGGWRPGPGENSTLFGDEASWDMSPTEYFDIFLSPEPNNYHTIILSTAGHWSLRLFAGLPRGYPEIYDLFRTVITNWVYQAGKYLDSEAAKGREKEVIVRPYLPGDDNCHSDKIQNGGPVKQPLSLEWASYNWGWIPRLNAVFEEAIVARGHPNLHYVAVDRPGRLRPDAHVLGDCLHLTVGTGVIEGWTHYIHYYTSTYLPWSRGGRIGTWW